jgi:WD40 repeat protein
VRDRTATLAIDPDWVVHAIPNLGLPLLTQVLEAHDPYAPLARIVRNQTHNLAQVETAADAAFYLAWEALRAGTPELHKAWCRTICGANGMRVTPQWTNERANPDLLRILAGHSHPVSKLAFDVVDGRTVLASKSHPDGTVRLWDPLSGEMLPSDSTPPVRWLSDDNPTYPSSSPSSIVVRGRSLRYSCAHGRCVVVEDATTAAELWRLEPGPHISLLGTMEFEGHLVFAVGYGDSLWLLNPLNGEIISRLDGHQAAEPQRDINPGSRVVSAALGVVGERALLATGGVDGVVRIWAPILPVTVDDIVRLEPVASGSKVATHRRFNSETSASVAVLRGSDRDLLAYAETDGSVWLWDPESEQRIKTRVNAPATSILAARQLSGRILLATGPRLCLWDVDSGEPIRESRPSAITSPQLNWAQSMDAPCSCTEAMTSRTIRLVQGLPIKW